jgi:hypothetical protein
MVKKKFKNFLKKVLTNDLKWCKIEKEVENRKKLQKNF